MDAFQGAARLIGMSDAIWARHAHPLSVWSRMLAAPLIFICLWSPVWIGWYGVGLIGMAILWMWLNPRLTPPPKTGRSWASKGVIGERIFINRKAETELRTEMEREASMLKAKGKLAEAQKGSK